MRVNRRAIAWHRHERLASAPVEGPAAVLSLHKFLMWVATAEVGERIIYAQRDNERSGDWLAGRECMGAAIHEHENATVFLAQRRRGHVIDYEATRISFPTARKLGLIGAPK